MKKWLNWTSSVRFVKGVGPFLAEKFQAKGVHTVEDLIYLFPRLYEDRRFQTQIAGLKPGVLVALRVQVRSVKEILLGRSGKRVFSVVVGDESGMVEAKYFRIPYRSFKERFSPGRSFLLIGKPVVYRGRLEFHHPEFRDDLGEDVDRIVPIYSEWEFLSSKKLNQLILNALNDSNPDEIETLPQWFLEKFSLPPLRESLQQIHAPSQGETHLWNEGKTLFQKRVIFEEFFWMNLALLSRKTSSAGFSHCQLPQKLSWEPLLHGVLPFELTSEQKKAIQEILDSMSASTPMSRLLQGDVGCGKTLVAFVSALMVLRSNFQVAFLAPTEILADQHAANAKSFFSHYHFPVWVLTGKTPERERKGILADLNQGKTGLLIGTHALLEASVRVPRLGLAIIDEQHRFGVRQRFELRRKNQGVHLLLMSATPIPRSLALTYYGDLDFTSIRDLPKGRKPIITRVTTEKQRDKVYFFIREQVRLGRQGYIIYPLVEESEKVDLKNATEEFLRLKNEVFPDLSLGLLHGKQKADEKEQVMSQFKSGAIQILVATTVVEVGVDVPNATFILIEHAERFGLAALHQLRGRVGRGPYKSYCILMPSYVLSEEAQQRLAVLETSQDGFAIAAADLEIRGAGELLGERQSGEWRLRLAVPHRDEKIAQEARSAALEILREDSGLQKPENFLLKRGLDRFLQKAGWSLQSG